MTVLEQIQIELDLSHPPKLHMLLEHTCKMKYNSFTLKRQQVRLYHSSNEQSMFLWAGDGQNKKDMAMSNPLVQNQSKKVKELSHQHKYWCLCSLSNRFEKDVIKEGTNTKNWHDQVRNRSTMVGRMMFQIVGGHICTEDKIYADGLKTNFRFYGAWKNFLYLITFVCSIP